MILIKKLITIRKLTINIGIITKKEIKIIKIMQINIIK